MIKYIKEEVKRQQWNKVDGRFLYMDEIIYSNRKGRDSDNFKKLQQDCITESEVVWKDDSWCLPRTERLYIDSENPRIEIVITPTSFVGIFDNSEQLERFESNCIKCTRYTNNCSILRKATEGRIQNEIDDKLICSEFKEMK